MELLKVMIVDDEPPAVENLCLMIPWEDYGFQVVATAGNGKRALELYDTVCPDIVMTDIRMPMMDGITLIREIQNRSNRLVKFVLLTAYKEFAYVKDAMQLGVKDYLLKHEINKENLTEVLGRFRKEFLREREERRIVSRHGIRSFFNAAFSETVPNRESQMLPDADSLIAVFVVQKDFSPLCPELFQTQCWQEARIEKIANAYQGPLHYAENAELSQRHWVVLFSAADCLSQSVQRKELHRFADGLISALEAETNAGYAVLVDQVRDYRQHDAETFVPLSKFLRFLGSPEGLLLHKSVFFSEEICQMASEEETARRKARGSELLSGLSVAQETRDQEQAQAVLQELLLLANRTPYSPSVCRMVIRPLLDGIGAPDVQTDSVDRDHVPEDLKQRFLSALQGTKKYGCSNTINRAIAYLEEHYPQDISTEEIAAQVGMTANHFSQRFKKETGVTVLNYLTEIRMRHAKELLLTGNYKVYEVAERVGYKTSQYFSKIFSRNVGVMPLEYKENH